MAGRHRPQAAHVQIPEHRRPRPLGITDAQTHVEHFMIDATVEHRHAGRYLALYGVEVLAASLVEQGRSRCRTRREQAASTAPGG
jgi:hypothetical protein